MDAARAILRAVLAADPASVRAAILRAYQETGGDEVRAAAVLGVDVPALREWAARSGADRLVAERWPTGGAA